MTEEEHVLGNIKGGSLTEDDSLGVSPIKSHQHQDVLMILRRLGGWIYQIQADPLEGDPDDVPGDEWGWEQFLR